MKRVRLVDLGTVPAVRSQTCYHAAACALGEGSPDTIILVGPAEPYVCIGFHQDLDKEVDVESCRTAGLPIYRREVGGGAVYLDRNQVFLQWVFHPASLPAGVAERFGLFIEPLVRTYRGLGIDAVHRPVNDIHARGRKIGGTGAAAIGNAEVVVGSLMFDFDRPAMARVLRVSSEKMRDKVRKGLEDYMTTVRDELGGDPDRRSILDLYLRNCATVLEAELVPGSWRPEEEARARELDGLFRSPGWLRQKGAPPRGGIKIHEDVRIHESDWKTPGGLIRATVRLRGGRIDEISITGDFMVLPRTAVRLMEESLTGRRAARDELLSVVERLYREAGIQSPGIGPEDWAEAISRAL